MEMQPQTEADNSDKKAAGKVLLDDFVRMTLAFPSIFLHGNKSRRLF